MTLYDRKKIEESSVEAETLGGPVAESSTTAASKEMGTWGFLLDWYDVGSIINYSAFTFILGVFTLNFYRESTGHRFAEEIFSALMVATGAAMFIVFGSFVSINLFYPLTPLLDYNGSKDEDNLDVTIEDIEFTSDKFEKLIRDLTKSEMSEETMEKVKKLFDSYISERKEFTEQLCELLEEYETWMAKALDAVSPELESEAELVETMDPFKRLRLLNDRKRRNKEPKKRSKWS